MKEKEIIPDLISNHKRRTSFWDCVYKPEIANRPLPFFDWDTDISNGPKSSLCAAEILQEHLLGRKAYTFREINFTSCDFIGEFNFSRLTFTLCKFSDCDFGRSIWLNAKFSKCEFSNCSFSNVKFVDSEFLECTWAKMTFSAEDMDLQNVLITNPYEFVNSSYTNTDKNILEQRGTNVPHQLFRLEKTKSKVARKVLLSIETSSDDDAFYEAVMTHTDQLSKWKAANAKYNFKYKQGSPYKKVKWAISALLFPVERKILGLSGTINGWGGSVGRAGLCGLAIIILFSFLYSLMRYSCSFAESVLAAIEITLLVGFTKYTNINIDGLQQFVYMINAALGLWWYAVFVPTIINRISMVKQ